MDMYEKSILEKGLEFRLHKSARRPYYMVENNFLGT